MNGGLDKRLAKLERERQSAGETFYVWINTLAKETRAEAIARRFPDGVPPGAKLVVLRWLTAEDPPELAR